MAGNIRDEIVEKRRVRVAAGGHAEGIRLPERRDTPLVPFLGANGLICEIKRRSPSRGDIAAGLDAVAQASKYVRGGAGNLSVLTEPEGFGGSLQDLRRVKLAFPGAAVLRKDFLFDPEDIDVSWRAGADAVLLIAGTLSADRLAALYRRSRSLGMAVLVEAHDREDVQKSFPFTPRFLGVNSRDLATFRIDPLLPLVVASEATWPANLVYESGIGHPEQAAFVAAAGFRGILVGEAVMRQPELAGELLAALGESRRKRFWTAIARRLSAARPRGRPLVKICGLTNEADARLAAELGADALGFVFWPDSPRRADSAVIRSVRDLPLPKVGVTVNRADAVSLQPEVRKLLDEGLLDAVQLHGDERPDACHTLWPSYVKAFRPAGAVGAVGGAAFRCPRVLLDAAAAAPGGTGRKVTDAVLEAWTLPLWLAGGVNPENVAEITAR